MKIHEFKMGDVEDPHLYAQLEINNYKNKNNIDKELTYTLLQDAGAWKVTVFDESKDPLEGLQELGKIFKETMKQIENESEAYWNSLSHDEQLKVFCAVSRRIHQGEIIDKGSYRHVLYDVFGFGPESYAQAQCSGYLSIHNAIYDGEHLRSRIKDFVTKHMDITDDNLDSQLDKFIGKLYF
jgi:hypothetical protein